MSQGQYLMAAVLFFLPHLRSPKQMSMPCVRQSLQGWRKLDPPKSRLPLPWEVTCFMVQEALRQGKKSEGFMMLFCFALYLRPGEAARLRVRDLVAPVHNVGRSSQSWSVVLHPWEEGIPSKTAEFDETVMFDLPQLHFIPVQAVRLLNLRGKPQTAPIFSSTTTQLREVMEAIAKKNGLECLGAPHPYRLRHGGASHDFLHKQRSLTEIQRRGRWKSQSSVRRYEKGGRIAQLLQSLGQAKLDRVLAAARNIQKTVQSLR